MFRDDRTFHKSQIYESIMKWANEWTPMETWTKIVPVFKDAKFNLKQYVIGLENVSLHKLTRLDLYPCSPIVRNSAFTPTP